MLNKICVNIMFLQFQLHHEFLGMMNGFNYEQKKNIDDGITQIVPGMSFIVYLGIKSFHEITPQLHTFIIIL